MSPPKKNHGIKKLIGWSYSFQNVAMVVQFASSPAVQNEVWTLFSEEIVCQLAIQVQNADMFSVIIDGIYY